MTKWILLALTIVFLVACTTTEASSLRAASDASGRDDTPEKPLFLHLLAPGAPPGSAAHRIASARVYLSQDFAFSVGDADNPLTNHWEGAATVARVGTNGIAEKRPLESMWNGGDAVLAGRVDAKEGKLFAQLQGRNQNTLNYFNGKIEMEKPVEQHGSWYRGGAIWSVWFVLSASPDCGPFLRALDNGSLRSPAIVERESPEAKHWQELNSNKSSGSTKAETSTELSPGMPRP